MVRNPPPTKGRSREPLLLEVSSVAEHGASVAGAVILNRVTVTGPAGTTTALAAILGSPYGVSPQTQEAVCCSLTQPDM